MKAKCEKEEVARFQVRIPSSLKKTLDDMAIAERRSLNSQMIVLLEQALAEKAETK